MGTRGLFATMLERADPKEAIALNRSGLRAARLALYHELSQTPRLG